MAAFFVSCRHSGSTLAPIERERFRAMTQNIFLVGLMAVGKTTVGRMLADSIGWHFLDTDRVIEERAGADIPWIFELEGEAGFRDREQAMIEELTGCRHLVLATGGGAVIREENRRCLAARGTVVHLHSSIERLVERTSRDKKRPLLKQGSPREILGRLQSERGPLYDEIADYRFVTDSQTPKTLTRRIVSRLRADELLPT